MECCCRDGLEQIIRRASVQYLCGEFSSRAFFAVEFSSDTWRDGFTDGVAWETVVVATLGGIRPHVSRKKSVRTKGTRGNPSMDRRRRQWFYTRTWWGWCYRAWFDHEYCEGFIYLWGFVLCLYWPRWQKRLLNKKKEKLQLWDGVFDAGNNKHGYITSVKLFIYVYIPEVWLFFGCAYFAVVMLFWAPLQLYAFGNVGKPRFSTASRCPQVPRKKIQLASAITSFLRSTRFVTWVKHRRAPALEMIGSRQNSHFCL